MKKSLLLLLVFCVLTTFSIPAYAASPWTEVEDYGDKTMSKLGFGIRNVALGWTKIIEKSHKAATTEKKLLIEGFSEGLVEALGRTVGGIVHIATFPLTPVDIPLPENGENIWPYKDVKPTPTTKPRLVL